MNLTVTGKSKDQSAERYTVFMFYILEYKTLNWAAVVTEKIWLVKIIW